MNINNNHFLEGDLITRIKCEKNKEKFKEGLLDTIIIHYTAGRDAASSAKYLSGNEVKASAHLVIDRNGEVFQLVPFDTMSWHAGISEYENRTGFNKYSIGIELDNAGILNKTGNEYLAWFGKKYPEGQVIEAIHRNEKKTAYWHIYTEKQIETCSEICRLLIEKYGKIKNILGHEEIAVGRKQDPGPAFPLDKFRNRLLYNDRQTENISDLPEFGTVVPENLNIRTGAGKDFDLAAKPLIADQKVKIIGQRYGWYQVSSEITGWVSKDFIKID